MAYRDLPKSRRSGMYAFVRGLASLFDFTDAQSRLGFTDAQPRLPEPPSTEEAAAALASDWQAIGSDMYRAMRRFQQTYREIAHP